MSDPGPIRLALQQGRLVLADGAMGTMLHARGADRHACLDALNLQRPEGVLAIHQAYASAGCDLLETNTFGANAFKLAAFNLQDRLEEINAAGVRLARQAAQASGREMWVAGSIGPLGVRLAPYGRVRAETAATAFRRQIEALVAGGIDLLILETFSDLRELRLALEAARTICDLPVAASLTFTRDDRTMLGDSPEQAAAVLHAAGADLLGANCSEGPSQLLRVVHQMRKTAADALLLAMPNAGWPERSGGRILYPATPDYFAGYVPAFQQQGVRLLGGCCGTTPEHLAAMRHALDAPPAAAQAWSIPAPAISEEPLPEEGPTDLASALGAGRFLIVAELDPPRGFSTQKILAAAHLLAESGADALTVADSPMARLRMSPWAISYLVQQQVGRETILHFPTRGRNLLRIQGDLLAVHALGIRNVMIVMGDPASIGDFPSAMDNVDLVPSGLIRLIRDNLNAGLDQAGGRLGEATTFFCGCALNLTPSDPKREMRALQKKIAAGAGFALTQPVFDPDAALEFLEAYARTYGQLRLPILAGILPLVSERHAAFLQHEVPGVHLPAGVLQRMAASSSPSDTGVQLALETAAALSPRLQGVFLMPALQRYELAAEVIEGIRAQHHEPQA
ncbi:MAG: bifunctional homocysteine S-methyltransferase/methylenetetrahydrofolate reductase [Anaerolineales bacterium]|nr:bifunctional homocysteine S-methyltransferase/methylenetetrahydrofolate reductase [Anaerolineales bacterium]